MDKNEYIESWEEHINDLNRLKFKAYERDDHNDFQYLSGEMVIKND